MEAVGRSIHLVGRRSWTAIAALVALVSVTACGEDNEPGTPAPDGSSTATTDAAAEAAPDGGAGDSAADGGAFSGSLLVATTDFATETEVATIDVGGESVTASGTYQDGDAVPKTSDGRRFVLERTNDRLRVLDAAGMTTKTIEFGTDSGKSQNPRDVVVVPGTSTAFVTLYNSGRIAVVDLEAGSVTSTIDLGSFKDASDTDGSPDVDQGVYVASTGLIYFTLLRIDNSAFPIPCPKVPSLLIAVDPATKAVVQLSDASANGAIELGLVSPGDLALDKSKNRLIVLANGCNLPEDGAMFRAHHGIEAVNLPTGATEVLYAPASQDFLAGLILLGEGSALVQSFDDNFATHWNQWDLTAPTLGAALTGVPGNAVGETSDTLLGVKKTSAADGANPGYDVLRYRVSTGVTSVVVSKPSAAPFAGFGGLAFVP